MNFTPWTKRLIIGGLIAIPIVALCITPTIGKDLCIMVIGGFLGALKLED